MKPSKELRFAIEAAKKAGSVILRYIFPDLDVIHKGEGDISCLADKKSNSYLVKIISREFPNDSILSEDKKDDMSRLDNKRVWIVDPLDGTKNFVEYAISNGKASKFKYFGVHLGLTIKRRPVIGVIYFPVTGELFYASKGEGAYLIQRSGKPQRLSVSKNGFGDLRFSLAESVYKNPLLSDFAKNVKVEEDIYGNVFGYRVVAITTQKHDVYIAFPKDPKKIGEWDICAPGLILKEAGGLITDLQGNEFSFNNRNPYISKGVCASNGITPSKVIKNLVQGE